MTHKLFFLLSLVCTIAAAAESRQANKEPKAAGLIDFGQARTQEDLQKRFFQQVSENKKAIEAWGLFSYSGWSNNGQILVIKTAANQGEWFYAQPNSTEFKATGTFTDGEWKELEKKCLELQKLTDLDSGAFDGMQYEFIHIKKKKAGFAVAERIFMNNPHLVEKTPHSAFIDGLFALISKQERARL